MCAHRRSVPHFWQEDYLSSKTWKGQKARNLPQEEAMSSVRRKTEWEKRAARESLQDTSERKDLQTQRQCDRGQEEELWIETESVRLKLHSSQWKVSPDTANLALYLYLY